MLVPKTLTATVTLRLGLPGAIEPTLVLSAAPYLGSLHLDVFGISSPVYLHSLPRHATRGCQTQMPAA